MSQRWLQIFDNSGPNTMLKCKTKQFEFPGLSDNNGGGEQWHRRNKNIRFIKWGQKINIATKVKYVF